MDAVAQVLAQARHAPLPFVPRPVPLAPKDHGPVAAVDGSHGVLADNGAVWVVAYQAAAVTWPGPRPLESRPLLAACLPDDAQEVVAARAAALGLPAPGRIQGAEVWAAALRSLAEVEAACRAAQALPPGGLLLVDGALAGLPEREQAGADRVAASAARRGVELAGVAKRSGLSLAGVPLVARVHAEVASPGPWAVPVPEREGTWVARLHARSAFSFRVDAELETLCRLVPLCRDAAYIGYPYPLAVAHNAVALTQARLWRERQRLEVSVGADAAKALGDFHDVLDRNVPA